MKATRAVLVLVVLLCLAPIRPSARVSDDPPGKTPLGMADILAWKSIGAAILSDDGQWVAYRISPVEGDSEIVIRETQGDKEYRFPCGEVAGGGAGGGDLAFSDDSKWVAFLVAPSRKEAARLKKQRKPLQNSASLVDLATGKAADFPKTKRFAFSGESARWIALHRYAPESQLPEKDRPKGSDLVLRESATGAELNVGNVADFAFDKAGRRLAWTIDAVDQAGNGLAVRDLETGQVLPLDSAKAAYERPTWTEKGDALAALRGVEDKAYADRLYALVAFSGFGGTAPVSRIVFDPAADATFPAGLTISVDRAPEWMEDLSGVLFGIREAKKKAGETAAQDAVKGESRDAEKDADKPKGDAEPDADEKPDLVLWHYQDKRLPSQQQVEEDRDRKFSFLSIYRPAEKRFVRLAGDEVREAIASPRARFAIGLDTSAYELNASMDGRRYSDVYAIDLRTGERTLAARRVRWFSGPSPDAGRFLYFENGHYLAYDIAARRAVDITRGLPVSFVDARDDHNVVNPPVPPLGWSRDGDAVLLSDGWDLWRVPASEGGTAVNLTVNGRRDGIRYQRRLVLDRDERGIDFGRPLLVTMLGDWTKKGGVARIEPDEPGARPLLWDDALFARVMKAQDADVYVFSRETLDTPPDLYAAGPDVKNGRKLTALDAQMARVAWSAGRQLVEFRPAQKLPTADRLQAALYLPANYQKGKSYPTVVYIYERLTQDLNRFVPPTANGFNRSVYTSNGYAVLMPDIAYKVNDPGRSAVWCVVPALEAAIATGVVDRARVGLQGHSWGGYQTSFLVTQTGAFAAAVAGAPLTNMVSMYSLIYKNSGSTNQGIFESSQGRFLGGYWDNWEAYYRNSPVFFARRVSTPLMILHNDRDGAVDFTQGVEYFNTLRRLGKPVWMLEYVGENHGLRKPANMQDYTVRMREFFDHYLKGQPLAAWMKEGVSRLKMEDHLKERAPLLKGKPADTKPAASKQPEARPPV